MDKYRYRKVFAGTDDKISLSYSIRSKKKLSKQELKAQGLLTEEEAIAKYQASKRSEFALKQKSDGDIAIQS